MLHRPPTEPSIARTPRRLSLFLLVVPLLVASIFVQKFSSAFPLTDEWFFLRAIVGLQNANLHSFSGIADALDSYPAKFNEHFVIVPFLFYWPIAEWAHFDSRWIIQLTLLAFLVQALLYRKYLMRSTLWVLPIALLLFCPSHFMEFLWGWQFTLAFSITFPLAGLVIIDRMPLERGWRAQSGYLVAGMLCFLLGTFSSVGGFFGFPCAFLIVALKPLRRVTKLAWLALLALVGALLYIAFLHDPGRNPSLGMRQVLTVLTALGGTLWGTPVGLTEFGLDPRSITGIVIVACTAAVALRACVVRALPKLALALAITCFGYLCIVPIAMSRPYLGNWHLQYALAAVCGAYAAAYLLWTSDRSAWAAVPFFALCALLSSCVFGYYKGFSEYGPEYLLYIHDVEHYVTHNLEEPGLEKPYPPQGTREMNAGMLLFLSAHGHPLFAADPPPQALAPLPANARVFLKRVEVQRPLRISGDSGPVAILTVALPDAPNVRGVLARIGSSTLILRKVHALHTSLECCAEPGNTCFMGEIVPRLIDDGPQPVEFQVFE